MDDEFDDMATLIPDAFDLIDELLDQVASPSARRVGSTEFCLQIEIRCVKRIHSRALIDDANNSVTVSGFALPLPPEAGPVLVPMFSSIHHPSGNSRFKPRPLPIAQADPFKRRIDPLGGHA